MLDWRLRLRPAVLRAAGSGCSGGSGSSGGSSQPAGSSPSNATSSSSSSSSRQPVQHGNKTGAEQPGSTASAAAAPALDKAAGVESMERVRAARLAQGRWSAADEEEHRLAAMAFGGRWRL